MKRFFVLIAAMTSVTFAYAQIKIKNKKYQSLLWEITGNGDKKPSYLFGTMHISSKIVFNLADSFYMGIKNAAVVALETNPESWQEDMSKFDLGNPGYNMDARFGNFDRLPNDYMSIHMLGFGKYEKKIEQALYSNPSVINNLLYRTYGDFSSDFEENTYLDMYIYQVGKKWGKRVTGVENYGESMKLMMEAYRDAAKDKNRKERSYDADNSFSADKLQEAYRTGNLDLLDSINKLQSFSNAFDEKFLYRRNEIQANSIDSILKSGSSLFVGVGAAHLPGTRGVIELLRSKGYTLRPVAMEKKGDGHQKDSVEKIHVPVLFNTYNSEDGFFKVDLPGKLYGSEDGAAMFDQRQYADMANGSYYIVTRLRTNNVLWGNQTEVIYRKIDSVLYENVPGKILSKQVIYKNGYKGFDILNRTRRGDIQRYNIFITPFEIIFFKMSGNEDYVKKATEANLFFNSIRLKEYNSNGQWKTYSPPFGGFSVSLPHDAFVSNDGSWVFDAEDKSDQSRYRVVRSDIHNYHFAEADIFDLSLMAESFASSECIDKEMSRQQSVLQGYPALDCRFRAKDGSLFCTRFVIQGPHYYSLIAHTNSESNALKNFFSSFKIKPFVYHPAKERRDASLYFSVNSSVFPELKKEKLSFPNQYDYLNNGDDDTGEKDDLEKGVYRNKLIADDSTGQEIYVSFYKYGRYRLEKDSSWLVKKNSRTHLGGDSAWTVRKVINYETPQKMRVWEYELTKPGSSRVFLKKDFYKSGILVSLVTQSDTITRSDAFVNEFFATFKPVDTLKGNSPFTSKSKEFFEDLFNADSFARKRAISNVDEFEPGNADLSSLQHAIASFSWQDKKYLDTKKSFINKLKNLDSKESADYLKSLYTAAGDTVEIQYAALETLLQQQTKYSMNLFRDIVTQDPPVLQANNLTQYSGYSKWRNSAYYKNIQLSDGDFMDELYDSLKLTRTILPGLLPLLNLDDYKWPVMKLLARMVDSNLVNAKDYNNWFNKFLLEGKLELKKQVIAEKKQAIKKAESDKAGKPVAYPVYDGTDEGDKGNDDLSVYATLLLPWMDKNEAVRSFFQQLLQSGNDKLKYKTATLLTRNEKKVPDSLLFYFAAKDEFRYQLYSDLDEDGQSGKFPSRFNNHLDLAKSKLLDTKTYDKPDSLIYLDSLPASVKQQKGFIYFFKYKQKKDDDIWKIASAGLIPQDPGKFSFADTDENGFADFTELSDSKLKDDEPVAGQLKEALKRLMYSTHDSAKEFYDKEDSRYDLQATRKY